MKFLNNVIYVLILFCFSCNLKAQTVKQIEVAGNAPYVDHISLIPGTTDMDLLVKISFNESSNKLTVNLISYRKLFVSKITYATHMLSAFANSAPTDCPTWWNRMKRQDTR